MEWWAARGVGVLYNNRTALPRPWEQRTEAVYLAGVPDYWMDSPDLEAALAGRSASEGIAHLDYLDYLDYPDQVFCLVFLER